MQSLSLFDATLNFYTLSWLALVYRIEFYRLEKCLSHSIYSYLVQHLFIFFQKSKWALFTINSIVFYINFKNPGVLDKLNVKLQISPHSRFD